jgi:putative Holliday junction resolvase
LSRVLAVDWGTRRIGLAVSDPGGTLARPLDTLRVKSAADAARKVAEVARAEEAETILVGLPLHLPGDEGPSAERARRLGEALAALGFWVYYEDERLTSEDALRFLRERGERRPPKERIDQVAALLLLQAFLDRS